MGRKQRKGSTKCATGQPPSEAPAQAYRSTGLVGSGRALVFSECAWTMSSQNGRILVSSARQTSPTTPIEILHTCQSSRSDHTVESTASAVKPRATGTWPAMHEETRLRQPEQADGAGRRGPLVRECDRHTYLVGLRGAQSGKEKRVEARHVPAHPYVVCTVHRCCPAIL